MACSMVSLAVAVAKGHKNPIHSSLPTRVRPSQSPHTHPFTTTNQVLVALQHSHHGGAQSQAPPQHYHPHIKTMDALLARLFAPASFPPGDDARVGRGSHNHRDGRRSRCAAAV